MSNERAIKQIQDDIDSMKVSIKYRQHDVDMAVRDLTVARSAIDDLNLKIKEQEIAIKILQGENHE